MKTLDCKGRADRRSRIRIAAGLCADFPARLSESFGEGTAFLLIDRQVAEAQPGLVLPGLPRLELECGEACKTLSTVEKVLSAMAKERLDRACSLVVVGGGSLGDLGGLVASLYLRGIELIQVPTSLLSMVDSSVGGKTAINLSEGKNLAGSFWPAREILIDTDLLASLPQSEFRSGLGEVLKMAIGLSAELFKLLELVPQNLEDRYLEDSKLEDRKLLAEIIALA